MGESRDPQGILDTSHQDDFITIVKRPGTPQRYVVELRRYEHQQGEWEFVVTQCSEPLGKIEANRLAWVWADFHRLEIR